jgi:hypothetical protein
VLGLIAYLTCPRSSVDHSPPSNGMEIRDTKIGNGRFKLLPKFNNEAVLDGADGGFLRSPNSLAWLTPLSRRGHNFPQVRDRLE